MIGDEWAEETYGWTVAKVRLYLWGSGALGTWLRFHTAHPPAHNVAASWWNAMSVHPITTGIGTGTET